MKALSIALGLLLAGQGFAQEAAEDAADAGAPLPVESAPALPVEIVSDAGVEPLAPPPVVDAGVLEDKGLESTVAGSVRLSGTGLARFPLDSTNKSAPLSSLETRVRVAPELHYKGFGLVIELDAATGVIAGGADSSVFADPLPAPKIQSVELRQVYLEYRWATGAARLGQQVSQFGLGMLSGSGENDAGAGDFGQSHYGSLAWRALIAGRPLFGWGGAWRAVEPVLAADLVVRDATADLYHGDRAFQGIAGVRFNVDPDHLIALFAIYRRQKPDDSTSTARTTNVLALDFSAKWVFFEKLKLGVELAGIIGDSTNGRSVDEPVQQVRQFGALAKGSWRTGNTTVMFDLGYASGDSNPYDDQLTAFRYDRDLHIGLILFEQVIGYQSSRSAFRASDPNLSGVAPEGIELLPSGGAVSGAAFVFPRVKQALADWLDVYGGPLVAVATGKLTDPFNTRVYGGGVPLNFLGRRPGDYLGTELDVGLQGRFRPWSVASLETTVEGGLLIPGNAFAQSPGGTMGPVWMARLRLALKLE